MPDLDRINRTGFGMPNEELIPDGFDPDEDPDIIFNPKSRLRKEREAKERWRVENEIELERVRQERDNLQQMAERFRSGYNSMVAGDNHKTHQIVTLEKRLQDATRRYEKLIQEQNETQESLRSAMGTPVRPIQVVKLPPPPPTQTTEKENVSEKWWIRLLRWLGFLQ